MKSWIAERRLVVEIVETGERRELLVRVGMPYKIEEEEFASCPIEFVGLFERVAEAKGIDLLQALQQASDIDPLLARLRGKYNFFWPTGEGYFDDS